MHEKRPECPTFVIWLLVIFSALLVTLLHYASNNLFSKEPSEITVRIGTEDLSWAMEKNTWHGVAYDRESVVVSYERAGLMPTVVTAGDEVKITMGGSTPDSVTLREYALKSTVQSIYGERTLLQELIFYFGVKSGTFTIPSDPDHPVRGYILTCTWGEDTCEYAIVVQVLDE